MRTLVAAAVACLSIVGASHAADSPASTRRTISIPAQDLAPALQSFAEERQLYLIYAQQDVAGRRTEGASGDLTQDEALQRLLSGTGLTFRYLDDRTVSILPAGKEAVGEPSSAIGAVAPSTSRAASVKATASLESVSLEEVVVTAQKREQNILDVPMSIAAVSASQLLAADIDDALDLSFAVPGVAVSQTGPGRQVIVIRGIGSARGSSSLTGVYLDEMPVTGAQDGFIQTYPDIRTIDLERVEVLKGPQGTLFGEGSAGGTIRFITKDPDLSRTGGELSTEISNSRNGSWSEEVRAVANTPLVDDVLGLRVAALYENSSGWIDQPSIGKEDINDGEVKHVRAKVLFAPTEELRIKGLVEIHRNEGGASNIVNQAPIEDSTFLQAFDRSAPTGYTDDYDLYNVAITYDFGFAELLSSTSRGSFDSSQSFTQVLGQAPVPALEILMRDLAHDSSFTSQELRLTSAGPSAINWTVGATYKDEELISGYGDAGVDALIGSGSVVITGLFAGDRPTTKSESWATFADASHTLGDRIEAGGGLRYFRDSRQAYDPAHPSVGKVSEEFDEVTFRIYLRYEASDNVNLYLNVADGFRSGGFNDPSVAPRGGPASYDPEESLFYEIGAKTVLADGRVSFSAALFYGEFQGMQEANLIGSPVDGDPLQFTTNSQDAELRGVEWDLGWRTAEGLLLTLAGDVTDSEVTWVDPANLTPAFHVGDPVNFVPKYSVSAAADYSFEWSSSMAGFFRLGFDRKGKSYYSNRSNPFTDVFQAHAPEVSFLNASLGGEWSGWRWSVFGKNLLDEARQINAPAEWHSQARPRTFGVELRKIF